MFEKKNTKLFTNEQYINAEVIVRFLYQVRIYYFDMKPIYW